MFFLLKNREMLYGKKPTTTKINFVFNWLGVQFLNSICIGARFHIILMMIMNGCADSTVGSVQQASRNIHRPYLNTHHILIAGNYVRPTSLSGVMIDKNRILYCKDTNVLRSFLIPMCLIQVCWTNGLRYNICNYKLTSCNAYF